MKSVSGILATILLLFAEFSGSTLAAAPLELEPSKDSYNLGPCIGVLVDPDQSLDILEVSSPRRAHDFRSGRKWLNLGMTRDAAWVRFTVENRRRDGAGEWILALDVPPMTRADLYIPGETGAYRLISGGTSVPLSGKEVRYRGHAYRLRLLPGASKTFYMHLSSEETLVVDLHIMTPGAFQKKERMEMNFFMLIAGAFATVMLSCLMTFISTREKLYIYLGLFTMSLAMFLGANFGLASLFLWPDSPAAARLASPLAGALCFIWGILFFRSFIDSRHSLPRMDRLFSAAIFLSLLTLPVTLVNPFAGNVGVGLLGLFVFVLVFIVCLIRLKTPLEGAKPFFAAVAISMLGGIMSWLMVFGILSFNLLTFSFGPLAMVFSTVLFIMLIGIRLFEFQRRYLRIFHGVNDPIFLYCTETDRFLEVNSKARDLYGFSRAEWAKLGIRDILESDPVSSPNGSDPKAPRVWMQQALRQGPYLVEALNRKKNGAMFWGEMNLTQENMGRRNCVLIVVRDVTERKRLEESLQNAFRTWQRTFDAINDAVCILDPTGLVLLSNRTLCTLVDKPQEEVVGKPCWETMHQTSGPVEGCPHQKMLKTLKRETMPLPIGNRHFEVTVDPLLDDQGRLTGSIHIVSDVTKRKEMQEDLLRSQKMESVGILAGGIAHDFNNILMALMGNIGLARMNTPSGDRGIMEPLEQAEIASRRARDLAQQLLTFARGGAPVKKPAALDKLAEEAVSFAARGSSVSCECQWEKGLWWVDVDKSQINQIFYNLVLNAVQAMPGGGRINVRGANLELQEESALPLSAGRYVEIVIQDEGAGIPQEHLDRIFDPYFTTKQKGSGLGLAVVYSIANKHGGHVRVESQQGSGAAFQIYLPAIEKPTVTEKPEKTDLFFGEEKILLLDDDPMVRTVAGRILSHLGYRVTFAKEGGEALELYRKAMEDGDPFDAVILDLTIPGGMGGGETMKKLLAMDPETRGVVSSGYSNDPIMAEYREHGFKAVISKPYTIQTLSKVLKELLEQ